MMLLTATNWQKLFFYGEIACFVAAWAFGLLVALSEWPEATDLAPADSFAATTYLPGIQATRK